MKTPTFSTLLQDYFCQKLINQTDASERTLHSYRDTFKLLLTFMETHHGLHVEKITLSDLNAQTILAFLNDLEQTRNNSVRTRNVRLAAIRSFMHYAALKSPTELVSIEGVLAIPFKRFDRTQVCYLTRAEMLSLIDAPDKNTWNGERDRVLFSILYNTGARVSEVIHLRHDDLDLKHSKSLLIRGKGRKERTVPLWKSTIKLLSSWLERPRVKDTVYLFPNQRGEKMTRSGVEYRLRVAVEKASRRQKSLTHKKISPHVIRHTTAMHLLESGVDITVIAMWLGHESVVTTHHYLTANLAMKEKALEKLADPKTRAGRYKADGKLLAFLNDL